MYANSSLLTSIYIPDYFEPLEISTDEGTLIYEKDYNFERDANGILSIIKLNKIPFIDLSKYDFLRRNWYHVDQHGGLWRKYVQGDFIIEGDFIFSSKWNFVEPRYYSQENLGDSYEEYGSLETEGLLVSQYIPITVTVNDMNITDITNYTGSDSIIPKLDNINPETNKEFYYDKGTTIYTNQDLSSYDVGDIYIKYIINIDKVNVKCRMDTNKSGLDNYTPVVDYYILSLTGQNL